MTGQPTFRRDLYQGTAEFYDEFRLPYPTGLIDDLCRRVDVSGTGRLVDLACGPGTATFALSPHFAEVLAVDQEPEAIDFAVRKAAALGVTNVQWTAGRAEDVDPDETFDLVTITTAFHRLDRPRVAALAQQWLRRGGYLALLWSDTPFQSTAPWQPVLAEIIVDWMQRTGGDERLPPTLAEHLVELPHAAVLEDAGFIDIQRHEFSESHEWTIAELIGFLYSTSLLSRAALGEHIEAFEADVEARLLAVEPSGRFHDATSFAYDLAYRPPTGLRAQVP